MRILYLISGIGPPAGWGTEYIQNLIFELSGRGIDATIITPIYLNTNPDWKNWIGEQNKKSRVHIIPIKFPLWIKSNLMLSLAFTPFYVTIAAINLMRNEKIDLVHEFSSTPIILLRTLFFQLLFRVPSVFTLSVYNNTILGKFFWFRILDFAKYYLIPSREIMADLANLGIKREKLIFSPPGINIKKFQAGGKVHVARKKLNLPTDRFLLTFFGSLTKEKGVEDIIKAIKLLEIKYKGKIYFSFFVIWKGSNEHSYLQEQIRSFDSDYVCLVENYTDIPLVLAASDIILLPQRTGHGATIPIISVIESIAGNKFIITTNILGNRELINKSNGTLVPPKNPLVLAKTIERIYISGYKADTTTKTKNVLEEFGMNESVQLHLILYNSFKIV